MIDAIAPKILMVLSTVGAVKPVVDTGFVGAGLSSSERVLQLWPPWSHVTDHMCKWMQLCHKESQHMFDIRTHSRVAVHEQGLPVLQL
jgi:hypothetical protein